MPSPSTHQDSPKVSDAAVVAVVERRHPLVSQFQPEARLEAIREAKADLKVAAPFLFSALLSNEVVERFAAKLYEDYCEIPAPPNGDFADESDGARERWMGLARDYLTAAIEHVGGAK